MGGMGGALSVFGATVSIHECVFESCRADFQAGAIAASRSLLEITSTSFTGCQASPALLCFCRVLCSYLFRCAAAMV